MGEVWVEGKRLDVFEGFNFSFNYSIADVRHPDKRNTEYSKTIKCPATQNNDTLFGQIYDVNISNVYNASNDNIEVNFNPNKQARAEVMSEGVNIMRGTLQLRKIVRKGTEYVYEVVFLGKLVDIFGVLGDKQLNGLDDNSVNYIDFSDLDHDYTQANQIASWTATYGEGYVYPMLDFGKGIDFNPQGLKKYFVDDFKPALYLKEIIDRIFAFAGFSYTSSFLSSAFFERLIVPVTSKTTPVPERLFRAGIPSSEYFVTSLTPQVEQVLIDYREESVMGALSAPFISSATPLAIGNDSRIGWDGNGMALICFDNDSTLGNFDNGTATSFGNYRVNPTAYPPVGGTNSSGFPNVELGWQSLDSGSYSFRVNQETAGHYDLSFRLRFRWREQRRLGDTANDWWDNLVAEIEYQYGLTQTEYLQGTAKIHRRRANASGGWSVITVHEEAISIPLNAFDDTTSVSAEQLGELYIEGVAESVECLPDDVFFVAVHFPQSLDGAAATGFSPELSYFAYFNDLTRGAYSMYMVVSGQFWNEQSAGADAVEYENYHFNGNIPEVGMADLLKSVINMFNLYVTTDPNQENNLLIETRDDFYEAGSVKDWTHKLDYSKEITLEPLALLTANEFEYTYSEDSDYYNERYQDAHGHTYGRARIDVDNDFLQNTNKTEVVFSPTPLVNDNPSNRIIGKVYDSDIEEGAQPTDFNIRVLYYAGLLVSDPRWIHASLIDSWDYRLEYPYAGHLTHPTAPSQDINFGIPNELYYSGNSYTGTLLYTNDNLFNRYHRRGLLEITNKDSKLKTAYFYLTPVDVHKLDFRDQILIDNSYWRINKVMNYNPFNDDLTKVELIKVITKEPLKSRTFEVGTGGTVQGGSGVEKRPTTRKSLKNGNRSPLFGGIVRGKDNEVEEGVTSFMVQGNRNKVKKGSRDVTIIGDDNTVEEGVTAVRLINTNGVTVTDSNVTFVNNRQQESSDVLEGGLDEVRDLNGGTNIFTVDGGLNTVQTQFSETSIYLIEGGNN